MIGKVVTIGAYGWREEGFFRAIAESGADTFCDLRKRRGVRGRAYAFCNSMQLQQHLADMGVRYVHCKDLAPSQRIRDLQKTHDTANNQHKRTRVHLSAAFVASYKSECLSHFDSMDFLSASLPESSIVALFCVEGEPSACHRSLVAERLATDLGVTVEHCRP